MEVENEDEDDMADFLEDDFKPARRRCRGKKGTKKSSNDEAIDDDDDDDDDDDVVLR